jgi:hypothetical protein
MQFANMISEQEGDIDIKLQLFKTINGKIKRNSEIKISIDTELRLRNITSRAALVYGSEILILNQDYQMLQVA